MSNPGIFRILAYSGQTPAMEHFVNIVNSNNYFRKQNLLIVAIAAFHILYFMK